MTTEPAPLAPLTPDEPEEVIITRPIAPEIQALLNLGRERNRLMGELRDGLRTVLDEMVAAHPRFKQQLADLLEGHASRLSNEAHAECVADRKARRG